MRPLTEKQVRACFVNASKREAADAIAAKDPDRAERVIRAHLNQISNAYWRAMEENGGEMPS